MRHTKITDSMWQLIKDVRKLGFEDNLRRQANRFVIYTKYILNTSVLIYIAFSLLFEIAFTRNEVVQIKLSLVDGN